MLIATTGEAKQIVSKENATAREIILLQMMARLATYVQMLILLISAKGIVDHGDAT